MMNTKVTNKKIAIFGGTFNPIHLGHMKLAEATQREFNFDQFYLIPTKVSPHKKVSGATAKQRYEMTALAAEELTHIVGRQFIASDYELTSEGISYSYRTLKHWKTQEKDAEMYFITGSDIFATIQTWQSWRELFDLANFIVAERGVSFNDIVKILPNELESRVIHHSGENRYSKAGNIILYKTDIVDISSTEVREGGCNFKLKVSSKVSEYIKNNSLYE